MNYLNGVAKGDTVVLRNDVRLEVSDVIRHCVGDGTEFLEIVYDDRRGTYWPSGTSRAGAPAYDIILLKKGKPLDLADLGKGDSVRMRDRWLGRVESVSERQVPIGCVKFTVVFNNGVSREYWPSGIQHYFEEKPDDIMSFTKVKSTTSNVTPEPFDPVVEALRSTISLQRTVIEDLNQKLMDARQALERNQSRLVAMGFTP